MLTEHRTAPTPSPERDVALAALATRNRLHMERTGQQPALYLMTFGCQMNLSDAELVAGLMSEADYRLTEQLEEADLIVIHTCGVREGAETRVMGRIGQLKTLKAQKPDLLIAVGGCMTQQPAVAEQIRTVHRHVNLIFGTHNQAQFAELLWQSIQHHGPLVALTAPTAIEEGLPRLRKDPRSAWVSIMFGCNNYCSYCIVPYLRGPERSRESAAILAEIELLVAQGVVEITLLGQNVNSYGRGLDENIDFADLLGRVAAVPGVERLRFVTSHPRDMSDKLIEVMATSSNVCHQLHLPVQAGSNRILHRMNRGYTKEHYLEVVAKLKTAMPDITLTTDIIVSFPGETEEDFAETLDIVRQVQFDNAFTFVYSPRPGTPAANMEMTISPETTQRHMETLLELQASIALEHNRQLVGKRVLVLVESLGKSGESMLMGRAEDHKVVNFVGPVEWIGTFQWVEITEAASYHLLGKVCI